ncbi:hypothetical protein BJV74DRAFT_106066 [Russula compacta]|nr:hypothetical protein BJV74DRAFT_106066 [Russula compacta]
MLGDMIFVIWTHILLTGVVFSTSRSCQATIGDSRVHFSTLTQQIRMCSIQINISRQLFISHTPIHLRGIENGRGSPAWSFARPSDGR